MAITGPSRRDVLAGGMTAALALAVRGAGWAQQKELVANTYGGGWEAGHRLAIAQPLEKRLGVKVTLISMLAAELVARTKAAAGGRPPVDVALVDDGPFLLAIKEGVFQPLPMDKIPNGTGLFNLLRQLGGSVGIAVSATLLTRFEAIQRAALVENVTQFNDVTRARLSALTNTLISRGVLPANAEHDAIALLSAQVTRQATMLSFERLFLLFGVALGFAIPLLLLMRKGRGFEGGGASH